MKTQRYQLRISGLKEDEGQIKMATLRRVMEALLVTAERTTRLLATGAGSGRGAKPQWLDATIDFTITGLKSGSTIFDIEAPQLSETAYAQFVQEDLWSIRKLPSCRRNCVLATWSYQPSIKMRKADRPIPFAGDYFAYPGCLVEADSQDSGAGKTTWSCRCAHPRPNDRRQDIFAHDASGCQWQRTVTCTSTGSERFQNWVTFNCFSEILASVSWVQQVGLLGDQTSPRGLLVSQIVGFL